MNLLSDLAAAASAVTERAGTSVVSLGRDRRGSGVVIAVGRVLTNAHNLRDRTTTVTFVDGRTADATVTGWDLDGDLAVLEADTTGAAAIAWPEQFPELTTGTPVFALANPGGRGLRVTLGFVSAAGRSLRVPRGRRVQAAVEHTAPLPRGSSGGPLVDTAGRLLGINALRLEGGLIVALPAGAEVQRRAFALAGGQTPARHRLGVAVAPPRAARRMRRAVGLPEREGLLVRDVEEGGPADRAGIQQGDLIVAAGARELAGVDALYEALDELGPGQVRLELAVVRGSEERRAEVEFQGQAA